MCLCRQAYSMLTTRSHWHTFQGCDKSCSLLWKVWVQVLWTTKPNASWLISRLYQFVRPNEPHNVQPKLIDLKRLLSSHIIIRSDCFQKDFTLLDIIAKRQERHNLFDYLSKKKHHIQMNGEGWTINGKAFVTVNLEWLLAKSLQHSQKYLSWWDIL